MSRSDEHDPSRREILRLGLAAGGSLLASAVGCGDSGGDGSGDDGGLAGQGGASGLSGSGGAGAIAGSGGGPSAACPERGFDTFRKGLPIPPVLEPVRTEGDTDYYAMRLRVGWTQLRDGEPTRIWGYEGIWPGPTIRARSNRTAVVDFENELPERAVVHLHGANTPPEHDGHPVDFFQPGQSKQYVYPNAMEATTLWYHDHAIDQTGAHVVRGLAGMYILTDDIEESLGLPSGERDVPLVLQDRTLDANNQLVYSLDETTLDDGFLGELYCVNGAITPFFEVANVKYRLRILNGSNARVYRLRLSTGDPFVVIGTDGGLLPAPVEVAELEIASAERFDVVVDFSKYDPCTSIVLEDVNEGGVNGELGDGGIGGAAGTAGMAGAAGIAGAGGSAGSAATTDAGSLDGGAADTGAIEDASADTGGAGGGGGTGGAAPVGPAGRPVMRFDVAREETDSAPIPATLRPLARLDPADAIRTRRFVLDRDRDAWQINGNEFDTARMDATPVLDTIEIWEFDNQSSQMHPFHIHLVQFQILDVDGRPPPPELSGWKDTVRVNRGEIVRVIARYSGHAGVYVFHCHKLEHEDHHMMAQFEVVSA